MADAVRTEELAQLLRTKSRGMTIRQAAEKAGVSPATLWRAEKGEALKDIDIIGRLCDWIGVPPSRVLASVKTLNAMEGDEIEHGTKESTADMIEAHLRADRDLDAGTADALSNAFRALYEVSQKKKSRDKK